MLDIFCIVERCGYELRKVSYKSLFDGGLEKPIYAQRRRARNLCGSFLMMLQESPDLEVGSKFLLIVFWTISSICTN
jgi:hypothetical protein